MAWRIFRQDSVIFQNGCEFMQWKTRGLSLLHLRRWQTARNWGKYADTDESRMRWEDENVKKNDDIPPKKLMHVAEKESIRERAHEWKSYIPETSKETSWVRIPRCIMRYFYITIPTSTYSIWELPTYAICYM